MATATTTESYTPKDNPSFILRDPKKHGELGQTSFEERPAPKVEGPRDVVVEVKKTGICGSDVHYLVHGRIGDFVVADCGSGGMCLGHESAGVVVATGSSVNHVKPGDRVALEPGFGCGVCSECKAGRYNLCEHMTFAATPPFAGGTLARYFKLPGDFVYPLPDNVTLEEGAMIEPLSVAVHSAVKVGDIRANENVLVFGCGPVGLLLIAVAKAMGARRIIAVDINPERLAFAKSYAATDTFVPPPPLPNEARYESAKRAAAELRRKLGIAERGLDGIDLVLEASGAQPCIDLGLHALKPAGRFVQVGMGRPEVQVPITLVIVKEITMKGSFRYGPGVYPLAIDLVRQKRINLKPLITHQYPFDKALEAFHATRAGKGEDGKGVIKAMIDGPA